MHSEFVAYAISKLEQNCGRIEDCTGRLSEEQIWWRPGQSSNSIGNIILHLAGNIRQWIVAGIEGAPDVRDRDGEFATADGGRDVVNAALRTAVTEACAVLRRLPEQRQREVIRVQGYQVPVIQAVFHVVEHFSYHVGQIAYITKMLTDKDLGFYRHLGREHGETTP